MRKESFALRLRKALELREMSQKELSQRTGINESSISTYLKGEYTARQKKVDLMAEALSVDSAWLMGFDVSVDYLAGKSSRYFSDINPSYSAKEVANHWKSRCCTQVMKKGSRVSRLPLEKLNTISVLSLSKSP